ncbi:strawberry notch-like NTP hydrolase domain-containing protein [Marinilabilia salmonicolor]|uniref:Strawberry notch-like protein n=1 Tax=Marinilabilia salmonicolor TaxID=989 RepID=A0A368ULN8_9BACT|nr:strawberry notch family protein [Marinilabilia salmonicolor]RCW29662.1 strawberry notch-like protein [Marinilabilia salmonicolor]
MTFHIQIDKKKQPLQSKATITFDKRPAPDVSEKLLFWGFEPASGFKKFSARLKDLSERNPHHWQLFLTSRGYKSAVTGLGELYIPVSEEGVILETQVPDSMADETHIAARKIKKHIGGNVFELVRKKLGYKSKEELASALSAEQIDAVALAIYNIEERNQSLIVGDQTGIGKGRIAAAMIRYANQQKKIPIFLSEKPNLFSDIYRDLADIGSGHLVPFIVNADDAKTKIKDAEGNILYQPDAKAVQESVFKSQQLPKKYDVILATYTQFNQPEKKPLKPMFLATMAEGNIIIMDEAHNASGASQTGTFLMNVIQNAAGVVFLSATFAKRPDNMPIYALKTCLSEANMTKDELVDSITRGGVALQEILSAQLVSEGQMIRRERSFEGIEVDYVTLTENEREHRRIADKVTEIIRDIIAFQKDYVTEAVDNMDDAMKAEGGEAQARKGTSSGGVDNQPYFSKVFNVVNQLLLSLKAEDVARDAIRSLKAGRKPIIAFANTMGSFLEEIAESAPGEAINTDFKHVLYKGLKSVLKITITDYRGQKKYDYLEPAMISEEALAEYNRITDEIDRVSTGITISPIDRIVEIIEKAGFKVAEVTGRKIMVQFSGRETGTILSRKRVATNDAFRQFNDNEVDCLLINQSGSTGASAHAIVTRKVAKGQVKQREMIVLQPELDINTEVQKRGRINRTGQILKPRYRYISSAIPAEKRLQMMLQRKLRSLDANTTSNQKANQSQIGEQVDFLNKYGDKLVADYLIENPEIDEMLGKPLGSEVPEVREGGIQKVSGRVAILSVTDQEKFYTDMALRYTEYVEYLKQIEEYDLEVEAVALDAVVIDRKVIKAGKGGKSAFGRDSILKTCDCVNLRKPFRKEQIQELIRQTTGTDDPMAYTEKIIAGMEKSLEARLQNMLNHIDERLEVARRHIRQEKNYKKLKSQAEQSAYLKKRMGEIENSKASLIKSEQEKSELLRRAIRNRIRIFYPGRGVYVPNIVSNDPSPSVFLGFVINHKDENPYTLSKIKVRFAVGDGRKYMVLALSGDQGAMVERIIGLSSSLDNYSQVEILNQWDEMMKKRQADRITRYIITDNILQGIANYRGKLIDFTLQGGGKEKGILMPDGWEKDKATASVQVPVIKILPYLQSLQRNSLVALTNGIVLSRGYDGYDLVIPYGSRNKDIYTDSDLFRLMNGNDGFNKRSSNMVGNFDPSLLSKVTQILQDKYSLSAQMSRTMYELIFEDEDVSEVIAHKDPDEAYARHQLAIDKKRYKQRIGQNKANTKQKVISLATALELEMEMEFEF